MKKKISPNKSPQIEIPYEPESHMLQRTPPFHESLIYRHDSGIPLQQRPLKSNEREVPVDQAYDPEEQTHAAHLRKIILMLNLLQISAIQKTPALIPRDQSQPMPNACLIYIPNTKEICQTTCD